MSGTYDPSPSPSSSPPQSSPAPADIPEFDHGTFVLNIDILLVCVFAVFVLFALPRAAVRFAHRSEWTTGNILRLGATGSPKPFPRLPLHESVVSGPSAVHLSGERTFDEKAVGQGGEGRVNLVSEVGVSRNMSSASNNRLVRNAAEIGGTSPPPFYYPPAHMQGWESYFPRLASYMRCTIRPGLLFGQALILLGYMGIILYAGLYESNPFAEPVRAGFVAMSQIPVVIVLATKNNLAAMLLGIAYDKLNYIHRFAGLLFVLAVNVHAIGFFYRWTSEGSFSEQMTDPAMQAALAALIATDLLALFSTSFFRRKFYQFFIALHVIALISLLVAVCIHTEDAIPYVAASVAAYALDRILRIVKTRYTTARLSTLKELKMTLIEIPKVTSGWKAGQHVRIRIISSGMGALRWAECHPFTIASASKGLSGEGLVLMSKNSGQWTRKLHDLAQNSQCGEIGGLGNDIKVLVEGPYGGPGHLMFASFSGALLVAGGSGITFSLGVVQDLIQKDLEGKSRIKVIELVWAVQDPSSIIPLLPLLSDLLSYRTFASLRISVFYTRAVPSDDSLERLSRSSLPTGLDLSPGRPSLQQTLTNAIDQVCSPSRKRDANTLFGIEDQLSGVVVGVCGPSGLAEEVRRVVGRADPKRRNDVGGIELHEEAFGG